MIAEQYINEGIRIRKEYIRNLKEILKLEPLILEKRKSFDKIQEQMENIVYSDLNAVRKTLDLNGRLMDMEKEIKTIQDTIRPFYENIEKLENDSDRLYLSIKEKYPNITNKEIEYEIMSRVDE
jgi:predicted  nucleic acid-binding Zn-ribbon protein